MHKFLQDKDFRQRYKLRGFTDNEFIEMVNNCFKDYSSLEAIRKLSNYVLEKLGGFEIKDWTLRTEIEN